MRKITFLAAIIGMIMLQSCTVNQAETPVDNDTIAEVFEVTRSFTSSNGFSNLVTFPHVIYNSDMVLAYRLDAVVNGTDVWKLMPQTFYFTNGTLDFSYNFDFTKYDINLYMEGNNLSTIQSQYRINQVFRIVIIPAAFSNKMSVDYNDYNAVIQLYNIDKSKIIKIK